MPRGGSNMPNTRSSSADEIGIAVAEPDEHERALDVELARVLAQIDRARQRAAHAARRHDVGVEVAEHLDQRAAARRQLAELLVRDDARGRPALGRAGLERVLEDVAGERRPHVAERQLRERLRQRRHLGGRGPDLLRRSGRRPLRRARGRGSPTARTRLPLCSSFSRSLVAASSPSRPRVSSAFVMRSSICFQLGTPIPAPTTRAALPVRICSMRDSGIVCSCILNPQACSLIGAHRSDRSRWGQPKSGLAARRCGPARCGKLCGRCGSDASSRSPSSSSARWSAC